MKPQGRPGPRRTLWNPDTLLEPSNHHHPAALDGTLPWTTPQPLQNVEPWWNPGGTWWNFGGTWWNLGGTLVDPGGTLVEPWWNCRGTLPQTTPDHPAALADWWNPGKTLVEPWWNPGGILVEPWWNPRGTLPQGRPGPPGAYLG